MATPSVDGVKYWFDGLPITGVQQSTTDNGSTKYWFNGLPIEFLASYAAPPVGVPRFFVVFID